MSEHEVLPDALPLEIHSPEVQLGSYVSLLRGHSEPVSRRGLILRHPPAIPIEQSKDELGINIPLLSGPKNPQHCICIALIHPPTLHIHDAEI